MKAYVLNHSRKQAASKDLRSKPLLQGYEPVIIETNMQYILCLIKLVLGTKCKVYISKSHGIKALIICLISRFYNVSVHADLSDFIFKKVEDYINPIELVSLWLTAVMYRNCSEITASSPQILALFDLSYKNRLLRVYEDSIRPDELKTAPIYSSLKGMISPHKVCCYGNLEVQFNPSNNIAQDLIYQLADASNAHNLQIIVVARPTNIIYQFIAKLNQKIYNKGLLIPWSWANQHRYTVASQYAFFPESNTVEELFKSTGRVDYALARGCRVISGYRPSVIQKYFQDDRVFFGNLADGIKFFINEGDEIK